MNFKVNVNSKVKVKLTNYGISILKKQHDDLNRSIKESGAKGLGEFELFLDKDGYYCTSLWLLMNKFGHAMYMGNDNPFDMNIIIEDGEVI